MFYGILRTVEEPLVSLVAVVKWFVLLRMIWVCGFVLVDSFRGY